MFVSILRLYSSIHFNLEKLFFHQLVFVSLADGRTNPRVSIINFFMQREI